MEGDYSRSAPQSRRVLDLSLFEFLYAKMDQAPSCHFALDKPRRREHLPDIATDTMKIVSQKQRELAMGHLAELLKRDGGMQTQTVQE
jgi:hypothetical protein